VLGTWKRQNKSNTRESLREPRPSLCTRPFYISVLATPTWWHLDLQFQQSLILSFKQSVSFHHSTIRKSWEQGPEIEVARFRTFCTNPPSWNMITCTFTSSIITSRNFACASLETVETMESTVDWKRKFEAVVTSFCGRWSHFYLWDYMASTLATLAICNEELDTLNFVTPDVVTEVRKESECGWDMSRISRGDHSDAL
jgi:hypothetical protein